MRAYKLENRVQHYDWGSKTRIPRLLGIEPTGEPFAELWMGAHPSAPSIALTPEGPVALDELLRRDPEGLLGESVAASFGDQLPFLFKVVAPETPISIQVHPTKKKAWHGFDRENLTGIPVDAPDRNYRDANHKPELVAALEPFESLIGFRPIPAIADLLGRFVGSDRLRAIERLERFHGRVELSVLFYSLMSLDKTEAAAIVESVASKAAAALNDPALPEDTRYALEWTARLSTLFPGDIGAVAPLMMNVVRLAPGQALFIAPGELHAHLRGLAVELDANSDNVLRGALTKKHVDIPELISVLSFNPERQYALDPEPLSDTCSAYPLLVRDFQLHRSRLFAGTAAPRRSDSAEIVLCSEGAIAIVSPSGESLALGPGESAFVAASEKGAVIRGEGLSWRASVPSL